MKEPGVTAERLMVEAERARRHAYAPYSRFRVGAALLTADGRVIPGCNVENASYGLSVCAECCVLWKAVGEGERDFVAIAVSAGRGREAPPCGRCRQVLWELAPRARVYWRDRRGRLVRRSVAALLPSPFGVPRQRRRG
jgi:cytidine deaminase